MTEQPRGPGTPMGRSPRVVRNDWSRAGVPESGAWQPSLAVSVVIPAYNCQDTLDLTLASLSQQTYPSALMETVIVDDGSEPSLRLPEIRPKNCRVIRAADHGPGWGIAAAFNAGVHASTGAIIQRLDADMVVFPEHVEAHARWHHRLPYAVTLGSKRFVDVPAETGAWPSPAEVRQAGEADAMSKLFDERRSEPHAYIEKMLRRTNNLRAADHLAFLAHVGATVAVRRELFDAAGGLDDTLRRGSDTEFGYRLAQAGALFVPVSNARSWHLGRSHMMVGAMPIQRYSRPFLADAMAHPRWLRSVGGCVWSVPLVTVVMEVDGHPLERVRAATDAILRGSESDLRILLVGSWSSIVDVRQPVLQDPALELRLIRQTYRSDPRVQLAERVPVSAFPSPYLLRVPATVGLARTAIGRLIEFADEHQAGVVQVATPGGEPVTLWRTAAQARAAWIADKPSLEVVDEIWGVRTVPADLIGVVDLSEFDAETLASGIDVVPGVRGGWTTSGYVKVAGVRSLARAAAMVAAMSAFRAWRRVRALTRRRAR